MSPHQKTENLDQGINETRRDRILRPSELGGNCSGYWVCIAQIHAKPPICRSKADTRPKSPTDSHKRPTISIIRSTQDPDHIYTDLVRIYLLNNRSHHGYIKGRTALLQ
ncbi:hypothetical protein PIB30_092161, partial [Stylosanthes scabra]|nr:hypothetical protein [Stylosanthes scabra]